MPRLVLGNVVIQMNKPSGRQNRRSQRRQQIVNDEKPKEIDSEISVIIRDRLYQILPMN